MSHHKGTGNVVFATYRAKPGKEKELVGILEKHYPLLRELELASERKPIIVKAGNYVVEIMEWADGEASGKAHTHPRVAEVWESISNVADIAKPSEVPGLDKEFPHFEALN